MELSIVIVSFNARHDLTRCLESLHASPARATHEILVVDNASTDGSAAAARRWPGVKLIETGANLGFARATNIGVRASTGTTILLLNSDTIVPTAALDRLMEELSRRPDVAVVGPRLVDAEGRPELSFGAMIGPLNDLRQRRLVRGLARRRPGVSRVVDDMTRREQFPDWVSGACLLVRRADAEAVGLLDERYFMYTEDVDFCAAIRSRGRRIFFTPEVTITHLRGRSVAGAVGPTRDAYRRSRIAIYEKHRPFWAPLIRLCFRLRSR